MPEGAAQRDAGGRRTAALGVVGSILLALLVILSLVVIVSRDEGRSEALGTTEPSEGILPIPTENGAEQGAGGGSVAVEEPPAQREPTEGDAAAFSASFDPPGARTVEFLVTDLDDDGHGEIVVASTAGGVVRLDVARWAGRDYEVVFTGQGGPAEEIEEFAVRDVTDDGQREIVTVQRTPERQSLSIWRFEDGEVVPLAARGGCWDGSHTYGETGATVEQGELRASCPPGEDGTPAGRAEVYTWDGRAWTPETTEETE